MNDGVPIKIAGSAPLGSETWPFFIVPVSLNDLGPFDFALELHYGKTTLLPECLKALGQEADAITSVMTVPGHGCEIDFPVLKLGSISVGGATLKDFEVMVFKTRNVRYSQSTEMAHRSATQIDRIEVKETNESFRLSYLGIIGYDFFKNFRITFDFDASRLFLKGR